MTQVLQMLLFSASYLAHILLAAGPISISGPEMHSQQFSVGHTSGERQLTSGFKGVSWKRTEKKWKAQIQHNGSQVYLGLFTDEAAAAAAYDMARLQLQGKQAKWLNFPLAKYLDGDGNVIEDQGVRERLERKRWVGGSQHLPKLHKT